MNVQLTTAFCSSSSSVFMFELAAFNSLVSLLILSEAFLDSSLLFTAKANQHTGKFAHL